MKKILALFAIGLTALACSLTSSPASTPAPTAAPVIPTSVPALTADQVKNAAYQLVFQDAHKTIQLKDGIFQNTTDPTSPDYMDIVLAPQMAFGDLNGDGIGDAAVLLAENYGGTGVFVSVVAVLSQNGQPLQAGAQMVDDRPMVNSLTIQNGQILLDATVHGPNDPGCCAMQPVKNVYRLVNGKLVFASISMKTPDGTERAITIDSPADGSTVSLPLTITGKVTIAPFENTLLYVVFDANNNELKKGSFQVSADQPGSAGTFSLPLDLSGVTGPVRIQIEDASAADGSILALGSVTVIIK
jgi:hypothetical protein